MINAIVAYNNGSASARLLSDYLNVPILKKKGTKYRGIKGNAVVNWGSQVVPPETWGSTIVNNPDYVAIAANKLRTFQAWGEKPYVCPWTADRGVAATWVAEGHSVVCRTLLGAQGGKGIVIADTPDQLVDAPLYTKYIKKLSEYRVHRVGNDWHVAEKAQRKDWDGERNPRIRNHDNGYIYKVNGIDPPQCVVNAGFDAVGDLGLDFGAADVIYNRFYNKAYVLEVNTAPGIEGSTVEFYGNSLRKYFG